MTRADRPPTEVVQSATGRETLALQEAVLEVVRGPDRARECPIRISGTTVGTDPTCDLVLTDTTVSRRQFEVRPTEGGFLLCDLGSTNGTLVQQLRVERAMVPAQVKIVVGRTTITIRTQRGRQQHPLSQHHQFGSLVGQSPAMRHCFDLLERAAQSDSTVLIEGESGTGKELAARSLHEQSGRAENPLVIVDCAAIAPTLIESELFGHEKGAFTGAVAQRAGAFRRAHGGTVFLDEIGELTPALQPRLLRFLERREVRPVGGEKEIDVDARVITATNRRLEEAVRHKTFRQDLFYRLAVIRVELPPLRHRPEDIPLLALQLAARTRPDVAPQTWLDDRALAVFQSYGWPGNVRELRNVVERLALLPDWQPEKLLGGNHDAGERPSEPPTTESVMALPYHQAKERVLERFERQYLQRLLARADGVVAHAAERAGVPRQTFFRLIRKHNLRES